VYLSNQPELGKAAGGGFWTKALEAVSKVVKKRKADVAERARQKEEERQMKLAAKMDATTQTAGFGGINPWMLAGAAALVIAGPWLLKKLRGGRRR
jgi:hypothetical protein